MSAVPLLIDAAHPAFEGHFPGAPILPGAVLLDAAIRAIEQARGGAPRRWRLSSVKFARAVAPGEALTLEQQSLEHGAVRFKISSAGHAVATGVLAAL